MSFVSYLWLVICQYFSQLKSFFGFNKQGGSSDSRPPSSPVNGQGTQNLQTSDSSPPSSPVHWLTPQFNTPSGFAAQESTPSGNNSGRQSPGFRGVSPILIPPRPRKPAGVINRFDGNPVPFSLPSA